MLSNVGMAMVDIIDVIKRLYVESLEILAQEDWLIGPATTFLCPNILGGTTAVFYS